MARLFISYRRADSAGYAGRLYDHLSQHFGTNQVFMDVDSIHPGVDFVDAIDQAVSQCDAAIVVIGRQWISITDDNGKRRLDNSSDFVRLEVETALRRNIPVIPVLVDGASIPFADELPPTMAKLVRYNALEVDNARFGYDVDKLIKTLDGIIAAPAPTIEPIDAAPSPVQRVRQVQTSPTRRLTELDKALQFMLPVLVIALVWGIAAGANSTLPSESWWVFTGNSFLLTGLVGGAATAFAFWWITPTFTWKHVGVVMIGWIAGGAIIYGGFNALTLLKSSGIGALGTAIALFAAQPKLRWRVLIIFAAWSTCFELSFSILLPQFSDLNLPSADPTLRIVPIFFGAALAAAITVWQLKTSSTPQGHET